MAIWDPWRGCHRKSEGCLHCYIHKGDAKRGTDTSRIVKSERFDAPVARKKNGEYKIRSGTLVYVCFRSDFLLEQADEWREACWDMIRERRDLHFLFLTKRIERFMDCIPDDWGTGYPNVTVGVSVENQKRADERLSILNTLPIVHKNVILQPMISAVDLTGYLNGVELVMVGGESDRQARPLYYEWVLDVRRQCVENGVAFCFRQCGTHFVKDGVMYNMKTKDLGWQARKAGIDYDPKEAV
ncbi:MAG: DUF5131 family protein [Bulleidia sp.]